MKIAVLINSLRGGGAERVAATLANQFSRMGNEVEIGRASCRERV